MIENEKWRRLGDIIGSGGLALFRKTAPPGPSPRAGGFNEEEWAVLVLALECLLDHGPATLGAERFGEISPTVDQLYEELKSCSPSKEN